MGWVAGSLETMDWQRLNGTMNVDVEQGLSALQSSRDVRGWKISK